MYKTEVIHRRGPWRNLEAVEFATLEWVDWFDNRRLLEPIRHIPPAELEEAYDQAEQMPVRVAELGERRLRNNRGGSARHNAALLCHTEISIEMQGREDL